MRRPATVRHRKSKGVEMSDSMVMVRRPGRAAVGGLRQILAIDAATCVAMGLLLVVAADPLSTLTGLPHALLFWAGVLLFPSALSMAAAAAVPRPALVWLVIAGNAAWALASVAVATVLFEPTSVGRAFVLLQAAVVAVLLVLERRGLAGSGS
jgi:hypothetical protein